MADGVTVTGLDELKKAVEDLPRQLENELRAVAYRKAREVKDRAREILVSKTHGHNTEGHQHTADSIVIHEQPEHQLFQVTVENPTNPMLGAWIERGTRFMAARPFMRPAGDAVVDSYRSESLAAAEKILGKLDGL